MNQYPPESQVHSFQMDFPKAMQRIILGDRMTRLEWHDDEYYGELRGGLLMLHKPDGWHSWIISEADMLGEDWIIWEPARPIVVST